MKYLLKKFYQYIGKQTSVCFKVVFSDGSHYQNKNGAPMLTISYKNRLAEINTLLFDYMGLFESYIRQSVDIDGNPAIFGQIADDITFEKVSNPFNSLRSWWHDFRFTASTTERAYANAKFHYTLGLELFENVLGPVMNYSCAYYQDGSETLEQAQRSKNDGICKKLQLQPGETLVDVGAGWGAFLLHACENYGVLGTSIDLMPSENLRKEVKKRGLEDKIKMQEKDYRQGEGKFEKYVAMEVIEHAGRPQHAAWMKSITRYLKDGGLGFMSFIGHQEDMRTNLFIKKHIFQGAYAPGLGEVVEAMGKHGLEVLEVENFRQHYPLTLSQWAENFDANWGKIQQSDPKKFNENFRRKWRLYLRSAEGEWRRQKTNVGCFQITFRKGGAKHQYPTP